MPDSPAVHSPRPLTYRPPARLSPAAIASFVARPVASHSGMNVARFFALHVTGGLFPAAAALAFYGGRGLAVVALTVATALAAVALWRHVGPRGDSLRYSHSLWLALLLAFTLPAHLLTDAPPFEGAPRHLWAAVPAAAIVLVIFTWLLGGVGSGRIHPVLVAHLFLVVALGPALAPRWVLQRHHAVLGDLARAAPADPEAYAQAGWVGMPPLPGAHALAVDPPAQRLIAYTTATARHEQNWLSLDGLLRDELPPLEDLILGGQPGPVGAASAVAVLIGGLFLLYRGVIDFRIPLFLCLSAFAAFLVLPIPLVIKEAGVTWRWLAMREPGVSAAAGVTFACYEMMAGPMLLTAFFLATSPAVRPMPRRARVLFAVLVGGVSAAAQLYVAVSYGPYLALLVVSLLTPGFDRLFRPRPLV